MPADQQPTPIALLNRNFVLLFQGQLISNLGNAVATAALLFWIKHATGSAAMMGALAACSAIPRVIFGMLGGTVADIYSRKRIIVICDLIVGVLMLAATTSMMMAPDRPGLTLAFIFLVAIGSGTVNAFFAPAVMAAIPDLVPTTRLQTANGVYQTSVMLAQLIGQALGGVAYRLVGTPALMLINGLAYLVSAGTESFIRLPSPTASKPKLREAWRRFIDDSASGLHFVWTSTGMLPLFAAMAGAAFFMSPFGILLPFYVEDTLKVSVDWFGYLMSGIAGGSMAGTMLSSFIPIGPRSRPVFIISCMGAFPLALVGIGLAPNPYIALIGISVIGLASGLSGVVILSTLQHVVPGHLRGRVMGLLGTVTAVVSPISLGLSGVLLDLVDQNTRIIFIGCGLGALSILPVLIFSQGFRTLTAFESDPDNY